MKKTIYLSLLVLLAGSCTEDTLLDKPTAHPLSTLKFEDANQMIDYFNSTINEGGKTSFQVDSEFKSFREVYRTALDELDEVTSDEQHDLFLRNYSDILTIIDSVYVPKITNTFYQAICNRDGIYESDGYVHKVIDTNMMVITSAENISDLQEVNSVSGLDPEVFRVTPYNSSDTGLDQGRVNGNCGNYFKKDYFANSRRCRNDRRIYLTASTSYIISALYIGADYIPYLDSQAYGKKELGDVIGKGIEQT